MLISLAYAQGETKVWNFRQTNYIFEKKNRNLDKQTTPPSTLKHQRDKQITFICRADI